MIGSSASYKNEILNFVDKVLAFYKNSKEKVLPDDIYDKEGYQKMWQEWENRRKKW